MAKAPNQIFNYKKWDNIELSDDESDLHPNIDKDSWFRMKHRHRLEREEKEDEEIRVLRRESAEDQRRLNVVLARMKSLQSGANADSEDAEYEDPEALEGEANELQGRIDARNAKINGYLERRKWNIDNICQVKEEATVVNNNKSASLKAEDFKPTGKTEALSASKPAAAATADKAPAAPAAAAAPAATSTAVTKSSSSSASAAAPGPVISRERVAMMSYNDFAIEYEAVLETYSTIRDLEATKEYLFKNCHILLHEHAVSYLLLSALEDEMNMKFERMKIVSRQSQILSHITELGQSTRRDPRDVILPFFMRIMEPAYRAGFDEAVNDFIRRIQKRAIEKRVEMQKERYEDQRQEAPLGPGGLNPFDVLEALPEDMRTAFEEQDTEALHEILGKMPTKQARHWMKQCVDSGLWVPSPESARLFSGEGGDDDDDEEEETPAAAAAASDGKASAAPAGKA